MKANCLTIALVGMGVLTLLLLSACSSSNQVSSGWKSYESGELEKAQRKFEKAAQKSPDEGAPLLGLAFVSYQQENFGSAIRHAKRALDKEPENGEYIYSLARFHAADGDKSRSYSYLFQLSANPRFSSFRQRAKYEADFELISHEAKFKRYVDGYRRTKLQVISSHRKKRGGLFNFEGKYDHCVVVTANVRGKNQVILATPEISEVDDAYYSNQYVIFDYKLGTPIKMMLYDVDVTEYQKLSMLTGLLHYDYGQTFSQYGMRYSLSDTEERPYTSGVEYPDLMMSPRTFWLLVGAAGIATVASLGSGKSYSGTSYQPSIDYDKCINVSENKQKESATITCKSNGRSAKIKKDPYGKYRDTKTDYNYGTTPSSWKRKGNRFLDCNCQ